MYDAELLERIRFLKKEYKKQNINAEEFIEAVEEEIEDIEDPEEFMENIHRFVNVEERRREDDDLKEFLQDYEEIYEDEYDFDYEEDEF